MECKLSKFKDNFSILFYRDDFQYLNSNLILEERFVSFILMSFSFSVVYYSNIFPFSVLLFLGGKYARHSSKKV